MNIRRFIIFLFSLMFFLSMDTYAASRPSVSFDPEGNLLMVTLDHAATSGVRYKTIGWTIKKTDDRIENTRSCFILLSQTGEKQLSDGSVETYFETPAETVIGAIASVSEEWADDLTENGGYVYLDAIMIVVENEVPYGDMDEMGDIYGEVYFTREGIAGAREWSDPSGLFSHFDIMIEYPKLTFEEHENDFNASYGQEHVNTNELRIMAEDISSPEFDVELAIPTGEEILYEGQLQKFYFTMKLKEYMGETSAWVKFKVYYYDDDGDEHVSTYTKTVKKNYSYIRIEKLNLYVISGGWVNNKAFPTEKVNFTDIPSVSVEKRVSRRTYMEKPETVEYWIDRDEYRSLSSDEKKEIAESVANEVSVRNDELIIDGFTFLDGDWYYGYTPDFYEPTFAMRQTVIGRHYEIPHTRANREYLSTGRATYRKYDSSTKKNFSIEDINSVKIHTPVVCVPHTSDDKEHDQEVFPTELNKFILGRSFTVRIDTDGSHKNLPGYRSRNYGKYVLKKEVIFPFEVYAGNEHILSGSSVTLEDDDNEFYLPIGVEEGDYEIIFFTYAKNYPAGMTEKYGNIANLKEEQYRSMSTVKVHVSGRMYDLTVTDVEDYPRWESVFRNEDNSSTNFRFRAGRLSMEGETLPGRTDAPLLPILYGSHPYDESAGPIGLGYRVHFEIKTIGSMRDEDDELYLSPTYYYMERDGSGRKKVRLYRKKDLSEIKGVLRLTTENRLFKASNDRNISDTEICEKSIQLWRSGFEISPDIFVIDDKIDLDKYIDKLGGRFSPKDEIIEKNGYLVVHFEIVSLDSGKVNLSYANNRNEGKGYCNMFKTQGFNYARTDSHGCDFNFKDGEFIVFDTKYSIYYDYESIGTH